MMEILELAIVERSEPKQHALGDDILSLDSFSLALTLSAYDHHQW